MARLVMIPIIIAFIAERSFIKNTDLPSTDKNKILVAETKVEDCDLTKVQLELNFLREKSIELSKMSRQRDEELNSLREMFLELNKVSTKRDELWGKVHVL